MKIGIITPIGPGHEVVYKEAIASIETAWKYHTGLFTNLHILPQWDLKAEHGRSERRNQGIRQAMDLGCEWLFFLDADDIMTPFAFEDVTPNLSQFDAIWGMICEAPHDKIDNMQLRKGQLGATQNIQDILSIDPFLSLQMGHFVRTECAASIGFNEDVDAGEDFEYYIKVWRKFKCIKSSAIFFLNRRGNHSVGRRSATGGDWRRNVEKIIKQELNRLTN